MWSEEKVSKNVEYCYKVSFQLSWLRDNHEIKPKDYWNYLKNSSLDLEKNEYIQITVESAVNYSKGKHGDLDRLIEVYDTYVMAYCNVLEMDKEEIVNNLPKEGLEKLAKEVGMSISFD